MPDTTPVPRFAWRPHPFDLDDSPDRYRALYAFSASTLNLSTSLWTVAQFLTEPNELNRKCANEIVDNARLGSIVNRNRCGMDALRQSMLGARELILLCGEAEAVRHPHLKAKSKRFPRFFLTKRDGSALSQDSFKAFVSGELQEAAMSLIAGALQVRDQAFARTSTSGGAETSPSMVRQQIAEHKPPDRHGIVNWLSSHTNDYKVHFNLACYFSRDTFESAGNGNGSLARSLEQLEKALTLCPPQAKEVVVAGSKNDPALVALRIERSAQFKEAIGTETEDQINDLPATGEPTYEVLLGKILDTLVPDEAQRSRLASMLPRMLPPSRRIERNDLLRQAQWSAQQVEQFMAAEPHADRTHDDDDDDDDRVMLARLLFLSEWPGVPIDGAQSAQEASASV